MSATATVVAPKLPKVVEWLKLGEVVADMLIQQRNDWDVNDHRVEEYAEAIVRGDKFPPVVVYEDADQTTWLSDGFTRYFAFVKAGKAKIPCEIRKGSRDDAMWNACAANKTHGWRRTVADKQKAVMSALKHPLGVKGSDRSIAEHCGCSNTMVSEMRRKLVSEGEIEVVETRTTATGKAVNTSAANTAKKAEAGKKGAAAKAPPKPAAKPVAPVVSNSDTTPDSFDVESEVDPTAAKPEAVKQEAAKPTATVNDGVVMDANGKEITDPKMKAVFKQVDKFHLLVRGLRTFSTHYKALVQHDAGCFLGEFDDTVLDQMADAIEAATPKKLNPDYTNGWEPTNISKVDRNKDFKDGE